MVILLLSGLVEQVLDGGDHPCGAVFIGDATRELSCRVTELAVGDRRADGVGERVGGQFALGDRCGTGAEFV
jgi:hypothetical protein